MNFLRSVIKIKSLQVGLPSKFNVPGQLKVAELGIHQGWTMVDPETNTSLWERNLGSSRDRLGVDPLSLLLTRKRLVVPVDFE